MHQIVKEKVDVDEVQRAITGCQNDAINRINAAKQEAEKLVTDLSTSLQPILAQKLNSEDLPSKLSTYAPTSTLSQAMSTLTTTLTAQTEPLISDIRNLYSQLDQKLSLEDFDQQKEDLHNQFSQIQTDLDGKLNQEEIGKIIDNVNKALTDVHDELDSKANFEQLEKHTNMQTEINQQL